MVPVEPVRLAIDDQAGEEDEAVLPPFQPGCVECRGPHAHERLTARRWARYRCMVASTSSMSSSRRRAAWVPFTDRLRIGGDRLVPVDVGLHVLRRDQTHRVPEPNQFTRPVVSARTGFHPDQVRRQFGEEHRQFKARETFSQLGLAESIDAMHLESRLGEIKTSQDDGRSKTSLVRSVPISARSSGSNRGGPYHQVGRPARPLRSPGKHRPDQR